MRAILLLLICLLSVSNAKAGIAATPLFEAKAFLVDALIPIRLSGDAATPGASTNAKILDVDSSVCQIMQDPYYPLIYQLKCAKPATLTILFTASTTSGIRTLTYGPVTVVKYSPTFGAAPSPTPTPVSTATPDPTAGFGAAGKQIFVTRCITCHTDPNSKKGRTSDQIAAKINDPSPTNPMSSLQGQLTDLDLTKLQTYLASPGSY